MGVTSAWVVEFDLSVTDDNTTSGINNACLNEMRVIGMPAAINPAANADAFALGIMMYYEKYWEDLLLEI
jgi:hypothetical protein